MQTTARRLAAVALAMAMATAGRAATFTWNGGSGNWSTAANWLVVGTDADGLPDQDDDIIIPNAAASQVITLDATPGGYGAAYWRYRSLAIAQTTAGVTQTIDFANHLRMDSSEYQQGTTFNVTDGAVILNTGSYNWEWNSLSTAGTRTFPVGVTVNATGGSKMNLRSWHNSPSALIQGSVNISTGSANAFEGSSTATVKTTFASGSILNLTGNGVLNSSNTIELNGTLTGDGTGGIRNRDVGGKTQFLAGTTLTSQLRFLSGTIQVDDGAAFNGTVHLNVDDFDYRSASAATDLRNVTVAPRGNSTYSGTNLPGGGGTNPYNDSNGYTSPSAVEVTCNADTNLVWGLGTLTNRRLNANGTFFQDRGALMLTDRHDNDPSSSSPEFMLVTQVVKSSGYENLYLSDATRGYDLHVNGGVGNWSGAWSGLHVGDFATDSQSTIKFLTPGGSFTPANNTYVSNRGLLTVEGPATVTTTLKVTDGGTLDFNGPMFLSALNYTSGTAIVNAHGNLVYGAAEALGQSGSASGPSVVIVGNLQTGSGGLKAYGEAKTWNGSAAVLRPAGTIQIQGSYLTLTKTGTPLADNPGEYVLGQFQVGRQASVAATGNFTQRNFDGGNVDDKLIILH